MRAYVINLDHAPDRLAFFMEQARRLGLDVERVPAIDGRTLPEAVVAHHAALPPHACNRWKPLLRGEIACLLSHRLAWRCFLESGAAWGFFAEDDIHFAAAAGDFIGREDWFAPGVMIVKAETVFARQVGSWPYARLAGGFVTRQLWSYHWGAGGYFLSRAAAERLVPLELAEGLPVDLLLFGQGAPHGLPVHQLSPAICAQDTMLDARHRARLHFRSEIDAVERRFAPPEAPKPWWARGAALLDECHFQAHRLSNHLGKRAWVGRVPLAPLLDLGGRKPSA